VSRSDDVCFCGLYNAPDKGGDWVEVRLEDVRTGAIGLRSSWAPKGARGIFDTWLHAFTSSALELWRKVWEEWSAENAVGQTDDHASDVRGTAARAAVLGGR
jgi:hypothetical protein